MPERGLMASGSQKSQSDARSRRSILWRRLDLPGHEAATVFLLDDLWHVRGSAVLAYEGQPCRLDYSVLCDRDWRTLSTQVVGWIGCDPVDIEITSGPDRRWRLNGQDCPQVSGCIDVDLNFSPATNLLPIRRLDLSEGQEAPVRAAWLHFPGLELESLEQVYRRTGRRTYVYRSHDGSFVREIEVDEFGLVVHYPGFWQMEAQTTVPNG